VCRDVSPPPPSFKLQTSPSKTAQITLRVAPSRETPRLTSNISCCFGAIMSPLVVLLVLQIALVDAAIAAAPQQHSCLSDLQLNAVFETINDGSIPQQDSCCMMDVCGLTCPEETDPPRNGTSERSCTTAFATTVTLLTSATARYND
jgi:hypothetical protein